MIGLILENEMVAWTGLYRQKIHSWWAGGMKMLPNLLFAVVIWILFFLLAKVFRRLACRLAYKISKSKSIAGLFGGLAYLVVIVAGLYIGLNILRLDKIAISLLAGAGIIGLTLAFAFQEVYFTDLDQNKLKVSVFFWTKIRRPSDSMKAEQAAILAILKALDDNHIERITA